MSTQLLTPVTMFCCGCSVRFGVGCIVFCHLVVCCFYVGAACSDLIFKNTFFASSWGPFAEIFYAAFSLVGVPIAALAFWGVVVRREINLRIYLFYFTCACVIDVVYLVWFCLVHDPCSTMGYVEEALSDRPGSSGRVLSGQAFLCGAARIGSYIGVAVTICVELYCLYIVWSMCEDIHSGKNGPDLHELIPGKDDILVQKRRPPDGPYASIVGFTHTKVPGPYPSAYGSIRAAGMPGQGTIFGGSAHETQYPPPRRDV